MIKKILFILQRKFARKRIFLTSAAVCISAVTLHRKWSLQPKCNSLQIFAKKILIVCFAGLALFMCDYSRTFAQEHWEPAAIQIATTVSDGNLTAEEVVEAARAKGIKIVIITDRDFMKWEYGLWPFRYLIKKAVEMNSVFRYGMDNYLELIESVSRKNPGMVILPGLEVAPYYRWSGSPLYRNLLLSDWHKHILVFGLKSPEEFKNLPVIYNTALPKKIKLEHVFLLWPILTIVLGVFLLKKKALCYKDDYGHVFNIYSIKCRVVGLSVIGLSILFLLNNIASPFFKFNQYKDCGLKPYQELIDYAGKIGALTFWAHPEAKNISRNGDIRIETWAHVGDLWKINGYTGFAIFHEGYKEVGSVGGDWDYLLMEYCDGKRSQPVWAIGGLAFDHGTINDFKNELDILQTYLLLDKMSQDSVLDALNRGRAYVSRGIEKNRFLLQEFSIVDRSSGNKADVGGEISVFGRPLIIIKGEPFSVDISELAVEARLIRNGKVAKIFEPGASLDISYEDGELPIGKHYYRLEVKNGNQLIVTNPVFVIRKS